MFSWGANSYGQLGLGHCEDSMVPTTVGGIRGQVREVVGGGGHTVILVRDGATETWLGCGASSKGQLGIGQKDNVTEWTEIVFNKEVKLASLGWDFSVFVTKTNEIIVCGANSYGQLGVRGTKTVDVPGANNYGQLGVGGTKTVDVPKEVAFHTAVERVSCGMRHTLLVTRSGEVFGSGSSKKGQLGISWVFPDCNTFVRISLPDGAEPVASVAAGAYHSAALTRDGQVVVWGHNKHGQLARSPASVKKSKPIIVPKESFDLDCVTQLYTGWTHLLAITDKGRVYTWGRYDYGQLGRDVADHPHHLPAHVDLPAPATAASVGSEHNLVLLDNQQCYAWGWNEHGICGTGTEVNVSTPTLVPGLHTVDYVACGAGHSFARTVQVSTSFQQIVLSIQKIINIFNFNYFAMHVVIEKKIEGSAKIHFKHLWKRNNIQHFFFFELVNFHQCVHVLHCRNLSKKTAWRNYVTSSRYLMDLVTSHPQ